MAAVSGANCRVGMACDSGPGIRGVIGAAQAGMGATAPLTGAAPSLMAG